MFNTKIENDEDDINSRYSRLTALEKMGVVDNYFLIKDKVILIVGIGGVGSVVVEMLIRCGIENLIIIDFDKVELSNMNRMFYNMTHIGMNKVDACQKILELINPCINIEKYNINIINEYSTFSNIFETKKIDLLISCVDNYAARTTISQTCNEYDIVWLESGISENAISGHIQLIIPGITACYTCAPPLLSLEYDNDKNYSTFKNKQINSSLDRTCAASLPTTTSIIAGLLVNNILKYFLKFGEVSPFLGYHMIDDYFPKYPILPNEDCNDKWCIKRQKQKEAYKNQFKSKYVQESNKQSFQTQNISNNTDYLDFEIIESNNNDQSIDYNQNLIQDLNNLSINELMDKLHHLTNS